MSEHYPLDQIDALRRGRLAPDEIEPAIRHLEECAACRDAAAQTPEIRRVVTGLADDLRGEERRPRYALAAALFVAAIGVAWWSARIVDVPRRPTTAARAIGEWDRLVDRLVLEARRTRSIAMPAVIREFREEPDALRGGTGDAPVLQMRPAREVVASPQPELTWRGERRERYVVTIECDNALAAQSGPVAGDSWTPPRPLPRGQRCVWTLERASDRVVLPPPPTPQPAFRVLDEQTLSAIAKAERERPDDHFLIALLYARAGVRGKAEQQLKAQLALHPDDAAAIAVLHDIESW